MFLNVHRDLQRMVTDGRCNDLRMQSCVRKYYEKTLRPHF